jgi:hypothetical protein
MVAMKSMAVAKRKNGKVVRSFAADDEFKRNFSFNKVAYLPKSLQYFFAA